jgi:hypothetical protein
MPLQCPCYEAAVTMTWATLTSADQWSTCAVCTNVYVLSVVYDTAEALREGVVVAGGVYGAAPRFRNVLGSFQRLRSAQKASEPAGNWPREALMLS